MLVRALSIALLLGSAMLCPVVSAAAPGGSDATVPPRPGANKDEHGPVYAEGIVKEVITMNEARQYVKDARKYIAPSVRVRLAGEVGKDTLRELNEVARGCEDAQRLVNGDMEMHPGYDERTRYEAAYRRFVDGTAQPGTSKGPLYHPESKEIPSINKFHDLCIYVISAMPYCPEKLSVEYTGDPEEFVMKKVVLAAGAYSKSTGGKDGVRMSSSVPSNRNRIVHMSFAYSEHDLLLAAYRETIEKARLSPEQKEGLEIASKMVKDAEERHVCDYHRAIALHDALVHASTYVKYESHENPISDMLRKGRGKCYHYAVTYALLCNMADIDCIYISGQATGEDHGWNLIYLDGVWAHVDVTWDDTREDAGKMIDHDYFGLTDEYIKGDHKWKAQDYPPCKDGSLNYTEKFSVTYATMDEMVEALLAVREGAAGPVQLDARVTEVAENPERVHDLARVAFLMHGYCGTPVVDYTRNGDVTLYVE